MDSSIHVRIPLEIKVEGVDWDKKKILVSVGQVHGPYKRSMLDPGEKMHFTAEIDR